MIRIITSLFIISSGILGGSLVWGQSAFSNTSTPQEVINSQKASCILPNQWDATKNICIPQGQTQTQPETQKQGTDTQGGIETDSETRKKLDCESNPDKVRNGTLTGGTCEFKYYGGKTSWGGTKSKPMDVLNQLAQDANEDRMFDNQLNNVSRLEGGYTQTFKITNTLDSIRIRIAPYMQWAIFIGLTVAVLLIIYNGFLLVTNNVSDMKLEKAKSNIINILTGVAVLTGFYWIIRIVVALLANFS